MSLSKRVHVHTPYAGLTIYAIKTAAKDFVVVRGGFLGGRIFSSQNGETPYFMTELITEGTKKRSKKKIREDLEKRGAEVSFSSGSHYIEVNARCFSSDMKEVFGIVGESLRDPLFSDREFETTKKRLVAEETERKSDPSDMGQVALTQALFPQGHPNYIYSADENIGYIESLKSSDIKEYHDRVAGLGSLFFVVAGDVEENHIKIIADVFRGWKKIESLAVPSIPKSLSPSLLKKDVHIKDKTSVSLFFGEAIRLDEKHPDFYPLRLAVSALGGSGFSARLMKTVRDKYGLTYGIYSRLMGGYHHAQAYFQIWGTFAPVLVERGEKETRKEVEIWARKGITKNELLSKKTNTIGSFEISLGTAAGCAEAIRSILERGLEIEYLDTFPSMIQKISLSQVNEAIQKYIDPKKLVIVRSGTL